ncbi:MAG TPA: ABC transporter permease subunit/CPBP intramembrane protease [Pirellulales bacterium]|jgi:sodium transport system permease protein|nr:ABC transporter permease subunit/CPBP intramembrane protease [Pirellulales bacterium]
MNWTNVKLILHREVRDQLRDRRTLFMIAVLPMLLYPLLGMSFFQVAQFLREQPTRVLVIDLPEVEGLPTLVKDHHFATDLFADKPERARLLHVDLCEAALASSTSPTRERGIPAPDSSTSPTRESGESTTSSASGADHPIPAEPLATGAGPPDVAPCGTTLADIRHALDERRYDVVVVFPSDFAARLKAFRSSMHAGSAESPATDDSTEKTPAENTPAEKTAADGAPPTGIPAAGQAAEDAVPPATLYHNSARETSQIALLRIDDVLTKWRQQIGEENLRQNHLPATAAKPFRVVDQDVAEGGHREVALWSKILPFVLLLWALTGAFYPAVDLCAGEKERGTLETLLSSPAERSEIVWGKLLTVMLFSIATAVLNLLSMGLTGAFVVRHMPDFGPPPLLAVVWLLIALVPVSALFSGLCLALAALARSSKEGQYYLMPLVLVTMPLTILPMSPGVELNLGNSLIPVTGIVLLLRTLLEGNYALAALYAPPVVAITLTCCLLAVRWAADQFNSESVLFRESERLDMGMWLRSLLRDREDTPSVAEALACGVLILMVHFFMSLSLPPMHGFHDFVVLALVSQLVVILTPSLLMTTMLTRRPAQTLLLHWPPVASVGAALLLAVAVHPLAFLLQTIVKIIYPLDEQVSLQLQELLSGEMPIGLLLIVVAVVPAICEELAFRGFILSGLRHLGHRWRAIILTSIFFGVTHPIFQQSLVACIVGVLLGFIAVQTGSILPGIVFHMVHNGLGLLVPMKMPQWLAAHPALAWLVKSGEQGDYHFTPLALLLSAAASGLLIAWFQRLAYARTEEESLQEAIEHQAAPL